MVHRGRIPKEYLHQIWSVSPPSVDAADCDEELQMAYLLYHNLLYSYSWLEDITPKEHTYTFVNKVDITVNDASNPFAAGPLSQLAYAPRHIDAMWKHADALGAVVQHWIYDYNITQQSWAYMGRVMC